MMSRLFAIALLAASASALSAQVPITTSKRAAQNAANKANAQLSQQTGQAVPRKGAVQPNAAPQAPAAVRNPQQAPASVRNPKPASPAAQNAPRTPAAAQAQQGPGVVQSGTPAARDSASANPMAPAPGTPGQPVKKDSALILRETYAYERDGRRDPFVSLMTTSELRPTLGDLRLTGVLYDHSGRRPVAVLRDSIAGVQWRVTHGTSLGRMRVTEIRPKVVVFTIEEFGFSRQDSLVLGDTTRVTKDRARSR